MFAVTGGHACHSDIIKLWEQRVIACGMTPIIYDLGGLGCGTPSLSDPSRSGTIEKALGDLGGNFIYTDPDILFRGFPSQLIGDWSVGVTVRPKCEWSKTNRVDAGVIYLSVGPECEEFVKLWRSLSSRVKDDERAINMLLADIQRTGFVNVHSLDYKIKVQSFPTEIYNCPVGGGVQRAIAVHSNEKLENQSITCGLNHGTIRLNHVYETFASDVDYQLSQFIKEKDSPAPIVNVSPGIYENHPEAVIISCFYNPQNNPYRLIAFQKFFRSIKHLNFRIIECLIGKNARPQLPDHPHITRIYADDLIWHKETLLNIAVTALPQEFKYIFIIDADVLFTNSSWMVDGVKALQKAKAIQPFEFCVHLEKNKLAPSFDVASHESTANDPKKRHPLMWRSFSSNVANNLPCSQDTCYDAHGHVGFAWGFQRQVLEECPLFEKALIGGADHILAHAAAGQEPHECIVKSFTANLDEVLDWSKKFHAATNGELGYAPGYLFHIWHGELAARQYLKRVKEFTGPSRSFVKGANGLYELPLKNREYINNYYRKREAKYDDLDWVDSTFFEDMGYLLWDILWMFGQPNFNEDASTQVPESISSIELDNKNNENGIDEQSEKTTMTSDDSPQDESAFS